VEHDGRTPGPLTLRPEAFARRLAGRLERPLPVERTPERPCIEARPNYRRIRGLIRRAGRIRVRPVQQRALERPEGIDGHLENLCPQYFLRNIGRVERPEEEGVPLEVLEVRDSRAEETIRELRHLRYRPPRLLDRMNLDEVLWLRGILRRWLFQEDWRRRFGRELKESVRGPLFLYDPDAPSGQEDR